MRTEFEPRPTIDGWLPMVGRWSFVSDIAYLGPTSNEPQPYGLAISNGTLRNGTVTVCASLTRSSKTTAGLVAGFHSRDEPYIIAQIGAYDRAFAISLYEPGDRWRALALDGSLESLEPNHSYALKLKIKGQNVALLVDEVPALDCVLPEPLSGCQVGLFAWDDASVKFSNIGITREEPRAFVAMPFKEPFDTIYRKVIRPVGKELNFKIVRADESPRPGSLLEDIKKEIAEATVLICELTGKNPNVFYELGYAHALKKDTILLTQHNPRKLPFDIRGYRVIYYSNTREGKLKAEKGIRRQLREILRELYPPL